MIPSLNSEPDMSYSVEQLSPVQKRIDFSIPGADVAAKVEAAFRDVARAAKIPGFRPGKVPRRVLEGRFGKKIRADVAQDLVELNFREAAQGISFLGQPELQRGEIADGQDFTFSVTLQVRPETTVTGYQAMKVNFPVQAVSDAEVEATVQGRLKALARLVEVTEARPVAAGDLALCEIATVAGDEVHVLEAGTLVNTTRDPYYPGIEALVIGATQGEVRTGNVTIGDQSGVKGMGGTTHDFRVTVLGVQTYQTPDLTDEVAAELGFEGGVAGMRGALQMEAETRANDAARNAARVELLQRLIELNPLEVPPAMVESHTQLLMEELRVQNAYRGRDPRSVRFSEAQIADLKRRGEFAAKAAVLLEAVARAEGLAVTDGDLEAKYQEIADMRGQRVEAVRGYFLKENAVEELRARLLQDRTLEWLLEQAELVTPDSGAQEGAAVAAT